MSWSRIKGVLLQEFYLIRTHLEIIFDIVLFPIVSVIIFGFVALYLSAGTVGTETLYPLLGSILWQVVYTAQYSISVGSLWNIWSQNLTNFFISPLTLKEYMAAHFISSLIKGLLLFFLLAGISIISFKFNIFQLGAFNLFLFSVNIFIFAWAMGLLVLGFIFRYGTRVQSLAWGVMFLLQPLSAAFFPVSVFPKPLQLVTYIFPTTFVFEAARETLAGGGVPFRLMGISFAENVVLFIIAVIVFNKIFSRAKKTGQFVRIEI